jgi:diaminopimelate epimerase
MKLAFVKMHGIGNDFVLLDNLSRQLDLGAEEIRLLADRRRGIGCDQLLMVEPAADPAADVRVRIFNQDGSEAAQCGNGLRCLAAYLRETGVATGDHIAMEAGQGVVRALLTNHPVVALDMGVPRFEPSEIPFLVQARAVSYGIQVGSQDLEIGAVSLGNPHAVIRVDDCETARVEDLGPAVQALEVFPEGVNVGFMQVLDEAHVRLRVFERGVGETLACGSGACAAVAVGGLRGWLGTRVSVALPGGELTVEWDGEGRPMWLTGPTQRAFEGEFEL